MVQSKQEAGRWQERRGGGRGLSSRGWGGLASHPRSSLGALPPPPHQLQHLQIKDQVVEAFFRDAVVESHCRQKRP